MPMPPELGTPLRQEIRRIVALDDRTARLHAVRPLLVRHGCADLAELRDICHAAPGQETILNLQNPQTVLSIYDAVFATMRTEPWYVFMNHGYGPLPEERGEFPVLSGDDDCWRHQVFLYCYVLNRARTASGRASLAGCDLLDVGCGRGGGISAMQRHYGPRQAVGMDLNPLQVAFCRERHAAVAVEFVEGTALALPFDDGTFDVITNVESSHCYRDMSRFLDEVWRVLKPGGVFVMADTREPSLGVPLLDLDCSCSRLTVRGRYDITARVQDACRRDAQRFQYVFRSAKADFPRAIAEQNAHHYASRSIAYMAYVLAKPQS